MLLAGYSPETGLISQEPDESAGLPVTFFAPAQRASDTELSSSATALSRSPLPAELMRISGQTVAILNAQRQIVAVNEGFMRLLGVLDPNELIGMRPGEALHCVHAHDNAGGCGTGPACCDCGAAIAIVLAQSSGQPVDRECTITVNGRERTRISLLVRATPFDFEGQRLAVLVLQKLG